MIKTLLYLDLLTGFSEQIHIVWAALELTWTRWTKQKRIERLKIQLFIYNKRKFVPDRTIERTSANRLFNTFYLKHYTLAPRRNQDLWTTLVTLKTLIPVVSVSLGSPKYSLIESRFLYIAVCIQENLI